MRKGDPKIKVSAPATHHNYYDGFQVGQTLGSSNVIFLVKDVHIV
jgi:hypothetical protein